VGSSSIDDVLAGGGELGERMRAIEWANTPLGPVESWPQSLRTCVRILLTSRQPMFVWWGDELINLYNDAYCSILGGKHPWALGRPAREVWREIWDAVEPRAAKAMRENMGTFDEALLLVMERNGYREETYYTFSYSPVPGDRGGPGGIICANSADAPRIFAERQQALLREVSACTADARTVVEVCARVSEALAGNSRDLPFALLYIGGPGGAPRLAATTGIPRTHALAQASSDDHVPALPILDALRTGTMRIASLADHADLPCGPWPEPPTEAIVLPIRGADFTAALVVGRNPYRLLDDDYRRFLELLAGQIGNSIANARAYEAERMRAEALAELDHAKTTFFSNISHEFRTPLTLMLGPTEDALRSESRALAGEALETVHRNELRLLKLVNALLDFSRIEAGRMHAHYEATDLALLTRELASAFRSAFERAGLAYEVTCDPISSPIFVDRSMWEKIVMNLLSNALKFTFEGSVSVRLRELDGAAELVVTDSGTGIPAGELPRLFERFYRVEGARSRTHEGSGIGLALTHDLVKLHRGTISVDSDLGSGARFTVRIPTGSAHIASDARAARPHSQPSGVNAYVEEALRWLPDYAPQADASEAAPIAGTSDVALDIRDAKLLVADDNADMRDYLRRLLGVRWKVTVVPDGALALHAAQRERPDLIVTDVMMPNLDGFGLLRALRAEPALATIPVVMLSARAGEEARIEGIEAGADDYLTKPFSARELVARVSNLLQLARLRRDLEVERNRLTSLIRQTPVAVAIWEGPELRARLHNDAYAQLVRREIEPGTPLLEALPEVAGTVMYERLQRVVREGVSIDAQETRVMLVEDGVPREGFYNTSYRPLYDLDGSNLGVIAVTADVTVQVQARQAIEHSRAAAESANRAKDEFLAMLGHELRNPLAPILTALELMRLRGDTGMERERAVIMRQTQHLASLVDDLLDISRITRGMIQLKRERVDVADVIGKAVETASPLLEQQSHDLVVRVPRGMVVDGDVSRLTQVFANLLTNAAKYTDRGGRITVAATPRDGELAVTVTDSGRGISPDMLGRVFELFTQERQNLDRSLGGLGLGLAIVKSLVELHGGRADATSDGAGRGSTFTIHLPLAQPAEASAAPTGSASPPAPRADGSVSILVVDDNVDAASMLADLLESRGYVTHVAHDAPQVLALPEAFVPDAALLDIGLPAMDGYELARRLRERPGWSNVRLLAITGYGQSSDRKKSQEAGFDHHLVKPIDLATLQSLLPSPRS
jgi:signal transduction histidine kinase/CheY-like chemotaxis protein